MEIKRVFHVNMVKRKDAMHKYNGIFLNHKKEQNNTICSNVDGPRDDHTKYLNIGC